MLASLLAQNVLLQQEKVTVRTDPGWGRVCVCVGGVGDGRPTTTPNPQSVEVQGGRIKSSGSGSLGLNHPQCLNIYCPTSPGGTGQRRALGRLGPSVFRLSNVEILMLDVGKPPPHPCED